MFVCNKQNKNASLFGIISENFEEEPSEHMGSVGSRNSTKFYEIEDGMLDTSLPNESIPF